ncbi:MAG TPA: tail fiber protein [Pyrinomonadaceae bacterium]|jgi:microcystin-dependent protein
MSEPFLGEIKIFSFVYAPRNWAMCNGQFLPINQNQALFSLLGTTYGGNGQTTFALPDLRSRVPMHEGGGHILGEKAGSEAVTITQSQMPAHLHFLTGNNAQSVNANLVDNPVGNYWANAGKAIFNTGAGNSAMSSQTVANVGGSQPHENRSPFLTLNFCIALTGIFPTQN